MKRLLLFFTILISLQLNAQTAGAGVTDIDGNFYQSVIINGKEWTTTNLKTLRYKNSDSIHYSTPYYSNSGKCFNYDNNSLNVPNLGRLYNWFAVNDNRGLAPEGWHVATAQDWYELSLFTNAGAYPSLIRPNYSSNTPWSCSIDANNLFNFSVKPCGKVLTYSASGGTTFSDLNNTAWFWTSDNYPGWTGNAKAVRFSCANGGKISDLGTVPNTVYYGMSVRLVKNTNLSTNDFIKSKVNIYPNPVQNEIHIETGEVVNSVEVFDLLGKQILNSKDKNIDVSGLQSGIYLLKINTNQGSLTEKIIKQ